MDTPLPPILETKLADFRRRVWLVKLAEGILAAVFALVLSYLLVFALDRVMETPGWLRLILLLGGALVLGLGLPLKWHRWVWRQRRLEDAARLLRRTFPRLGDQLLGIVELARQDHAAAGRSERLVQAAMAQAADAVKDRDFSDAVPHARHRQWAWAAAGTLAVALAAFLGVNGAARNAFARWLLPWHHTERYTFARIDRLPTRLVVPYAEPFRLPLHLSADTRWSPEEGSGRIAGQPWVNAALASGVYPLAFPPQKQDAPLAVSLGDVRGQVQIEPRNRPELTDLTVRLRLPDYLQYKTEPAIAVRGGLVSVLRGSQAAFTARASRPLAQAEMDGQPEPVNGETIATGYGPVAADAARRFTWRDRDGLTPREPLVLHVQAVEDEPPRVSVRRDSLEQVVLDSEVVTFDLTASDDFGVKQAGLAWKGSLTQDDGKTPIMGEKVAAVGTPEQKELAAGATFCAVREGVAPQTLELCAWADDYLPGRVHARSASFILHVLNKTDHALWLTEQFGRWLEVARESYEREQGLHEANKELRALSADELDRPENRRKVSQQATAENANAAKLDSLTQSGRSLVEQATKNDEFDAKRLETWASMLKSLKDIAANRMPSVSDLLKQTAGALGGKLADTANPGKPSSPTGGQGKPGAAKPGEPPDGKNPPTTAQNPPGEPKESQPGQPGQPPSDGKTAPSIAQGSPPPNAPGSAGSPAPNALPKPPTPSIADREKGLDEKPPAPGTDTAPKPPGGGKLTLPTTTLAAAPENKKEGDADAPSPQSPAQQKMDGAITEQKDLLAEFAKVSDQLSQILGSLEASTFVKRFKAASRQQLAMATSINQKTLDSFGLDRQPPVAAAPIARQAHDQSEVVRVIESDLDAYSQRKQDARFKRILDDMRKVEIVRSLTRDGERIEANLSGQSLNGSEYWADTLDRWGEELVAASQSGKQPPGPAKSEDSLPPEIVLKVMQALRDEMQLRDETRELQNVRRALAPEKFTHDAHGLGDRQGEVETHVRDAADDILALPEGGGKFGKELKLLDAVTAVMGDTHGILDTPETGPRAVGAETEAIELLLQAKRNSPKGGGGGGGSDPGHGGTADSVSMGALAELGPGADAQSAVTVRPVAQATGRAGKEFPDEFKSGLDAYFNLLEGKGANR